MKLTTKQLTLCAVLTALALAFSYLENFSHYLWPFPSPASNWALLIL
ncbi:MAG: hypothetical protein ACLU38_06970 [Dysosmobacter sp.]